MDSCDAPLNARLPIPTVGIFFKLAVPLFSQGHTVVRMVEEEARHLPAGVLHPLGIGQNFILSHG